MNPFWKFAGGRLEARDETGKLLRWWLADEAMGPPLAALLNHTHHLSRLLLWPLLQAEDR